MAKLTLPNLIQLKKDYPAVYDDLETMRQHINIITAALGGAGEPIAAGGMSVNAANGIIDVQLIDKHPQIGDEYFAEYATDPAFVTAHVVPMQATRNFRIGNLPGTTTYWRWYKSSRLGGTSNRVTFGGTTPTAVVAGNLSASPGPTPQPSSGSGLSQIPGYGWSSPTKKSLAL
jgi:hypothetical protein